MNERHSSLAGPDRTLGLIAAIACVSLVGVGLSLSIPLLAFEMERRGASGALIGANTAMAGLSTIVVAPLIPRAAGLVGVRILLFAALLLGAVTILGFGLVGPLWAWFPLRFSFGASLAVLFVLSEFWINAAAPPQARGFVMGVYATALSLGFACGPLILLATGLDSLAPYGVCAALFVIAGGPLILAGRSAPTVERAQPGRGVMFFIRLAPAATLAGFTFGAIETGAFTFLPLYGVRVGLDAAAAALIVSLMAAGNVASQIPLGLISDRMDRRRLLLAIGIVSTLGAAAIPLASASTPALYALICVWGGIFAGLYTVGLAHLGARFSGVDLATANAAFVVMYSVGMLAGPPILGLGFDLGGVHGAPVAIALVLASYVAVVAFRAKNDG